MSTEILLIAQVVVVLFIALVILMLMLRRQNKTINHLRTILTTVKDDISGENLNHHLQVELDDTTAHCATNTIDISAEYKPEDMAISIRFAALQAELALLQARTGSTSPPWREKIKHYNTFATAFSESIEQRVETGRQLLEAVHAEEIKAKNTIIESQETQKQQLQEQLANLNPLVSLIEECVDNPDSLEDMEQKLYKALLALCENFENSEKLREVVFLLHEAFREKGNATVAAESSAHKLNVKMLNNIIDSQNDTIRNLREQIKLLENQSSRDELLQTVDELAASVQESEQCLEQLSSTEGASAEELTIQLEQQHRELQTLQKSFSDLEARYLTLYREKNQVSKSNG